jgi:transcriptional regulator
MNDNKKQKACLTSDEAIFVWILRWQGNYQSAIAHHFKVNQGRVNEVLKERKHVGSKAKAELLFMKAA